MNSLTVWKTPSNYAGYDPVGDYVLYSMHRDSSILEQSNYDCYKKLVPQAYEFEAGHWAVGWVKYLMLDKGASKEVIAKCEEINNDLADYPVINEDDYSERLYNAIYDLWDKSSMSDRIDYCHEAGVPIFAARHNDFIQDDRLYEYIQRIVEQ